MRRMLDLQYPFADKKYVTELSMSLKHLHRKILKSINSEAVSYQGQLLVLIDEMRADAAQHACDALQIDYPVISGAPASETRAAIKCLCEGLGISQWKNERTNVKTEIRCRGYALFIACEYAQKYAPQTCAIIETFLHGAREQRSSKEQCLIEHTKRP